jgi:hypothetical protein
METNPSGRRATTDLYVLCLSSIDAGRLARAERQARLVKDDALRSIAENQIRLVLEIESCLEEGDKKQARKLVPALIGAVKLKYELLLERRPVNPTKPHPPRAREDELSVASPDHRAPADSTAFPPEIRMILGQLTQRIGRARRGGRNLDFSSAVLLQLGWMAHRAWRRSSHAKNLSPIRADPTEIRTAGACLRQRMEKGGGRLSIDDLSRELDIAQSSIRHAVRSLQQFLLKGSGWRMVGDLKTGFALEPERCDTRQADRP